MGNVWADLQDEYDDLLMKADKAPEDERRINEIESALVRRWGLDGFAEIQKCVNSE